MLFEICMVFANVPVLDGWKLLVALKDVAPCTVVVELELSIVLFGNMFVNDCDVVFCVLVSMLKGVVN